MIKNFLLFSCINDNVYTPVIFSSDFELYFGLLKDLNCQEEDRKKMSFDDVYTTVG